MSLHRDDAASSVLGWIVAAVVFSGGLAAVLAMERAPLTSSDTEDEDLRSKATNALHLILTTTGESASQGSEWELSPDDLQRFGLRDSNANYLDYEKIRVLRHGTLTENTNNLPDYPEVRRALALEGYDFHLRTFPILKSLDDAQWTSYRGMRVGYVGHFEVASVPPAANVTYVSDQTPVGYTEVRVTVESTTGPSPTVYQVTLDLDTGEGHNIQNLYTPLLTLGDTATVTARYYDMDWPYGAGNYGLTVTATDAATGDVAYQMTHQTYLEVDTTRSYNLLAEPTKSYYTTGQAPQFNIDKWQEDGSRHRVDGITADWQVTNTTGVLVDSGTVTLARNKEARIDVNMGTHGAGDYTITVTGNGMTLTNTFVVVSSNLDPGSYVPTRLNEMERGYIGHLFAEFNNNTYYTGDLQGDVFRDHQHDTEALGNLLSRYDMLVVGSGITQSQLQGDFKHKVRDWVTEGGTLIALGTTDGNVQWMKSIFGAGSHTATGGISTPDANHPMLTTPERLNYKTYNDHDMSYKIDQGHQDKFTHVILKNPDNQGGTRDVMAISNPGAYGNGTVIITSYMPPDIVEPYNEKESLKLLHNLVTQGFNMLFLDYGPPIPAHVQVGSASRLAVIPHPEAAGVLVEARIVLYVFR